MKHNWKITAIILAMFLLTQFIGLYVINQYSPVQQTVINPQTGESKNISFYPAENQLPYGMQPPEQTQKEANLVSLIISFAFAVLLIFLLMKFKLKVVLKLWFLAVVVLALGITFNAFLKMYLTNAWLVALFFAVPFALLKVFRPSVIIHNFTELLIYPGIAVIFVSLFNAWWYAIIILVLISLYDAWAVWHSGIMQKMAKYQMQEVGVFGGLFIPHLTKKIRGQIQALKKKNSKKKIKVRIAMLGGGDLAFTLIAAGIMMRAFGLTPALFVIFGAFSGLTYLFLTSSPKKVYPAMPFISAGIFIALFFWKLLF